MVHLVTENGFACKLKHHQKKQTFQVAFLSSLCTCPHCKETKAYREVAAAEAERVFEFHLKESQYHLLVAAMSYLYETLEEEGPFDPEKVVGIVEELVLQVGPGKTNQMPSHGEVT